MDAVLRVFPEEDDAMKVFPNFYRVFTEFLFSVVVPPSFPSRVYLVLPSFLIPPLMCAAMKKKGKGTKMIEKPEVNIVLPSFSRFDAAIFEKR